MEHHCCLGSFHTITLPYLLRDTAVEINANGLNLYLF